MDNFDLDLESLIVESKPLSKWDLSMFSITCRLSDFFNQFITVKCDVCKQRKQRRYTLINEYGKCCHDCLEDGELQ